MKYTVTQLPSGKWVVFNPRKKTFFPDSATDRKELAQQQALIKNIQYYYDMSLSAYDKLIELNGEDSETGNAIIYNHLTGEKFSSSHTELLC